jgi:AraC-like DNA-binding protein
MAMKRAMVLGVSSRALLAACEQLGLDVAALLAAADIDRRALDDPDARLPGERVTALWREALARSGRADLALRAAESLPFGAYAVIDFMCRNSATIGEGMQRISRYFPLINSAVELPIEAGADAVRFAVVDPTDPAGPPPAYVEYTLAAVFLRTRTAVGVPFRLVRVELAHPAPADAETHARIFECPLRFGAPRSQLVIARAVWDTPVARGDSGLAAVLERHAQMLMSELPRAGDAIGQVRAAIQRELGGGDPSLGRVARALGTSRRALQRRLASEGVMFNDLLDEVRSAVARSHLARRELSVAEVGYLIGFAEQSSFSRAFKRWTGSSPADFRRTAEPAPAAPTTRRAPGSAPSSTTRRARTRSPRRRRSPRGSGAATGA